MTWDPPVPGSADHLDFTQTLQQLAGSRAARHVLTALADLSHEMCEQCGTIPVQGGFAANTARRCFVCADEHHRLVRPHEYELAQQLHLVRSRAITLAQTWAADDDPVLRAAARAVEAIA